MPRISKVGLMRDVQSASKQSWWVQKVSCKRRPRIVDRCLVALAARLLPKYGQKYLWKEEVMENLVIMHAECEESKALWKYTERSVRAALSTMVEKGYIVMSTSGNMIQITPEAAKMMKEINDHITATQFPSLVEQLYAHCDQYRQRVGASSGPTKKQLEVEVKRYHEHQEGCPMARGDAVSSDTMLPISGNGDIDMYEEQPIAGPSTSLANPPEPTRSMTPDSAYLTPVSPPSSPTQPHSSFQIPGLEDNGPMAGPSSMPMTVTNATPARDRSFPNPTIAYPTPPSLPRRREATYHTLSPPPSPTPRSSFSHVHDADSEMNVDDNSSPPLPPSGPPQTNPPMSGVLGRCFKTIYGIIPYSILGHSLEPPPEVVTQKLECQHAAGEAARVSAVRRNEIYQIQHTELEEQISDLRQELEAKDANEKDVIQQMDVLRQDAETNIIMARDRYEERSQLLRQLEMKVRQVTNRLFHAETWRREALKKVCSLRKLNRSLLDRNRAEARVAASKIRQLQEEQKEFKGRAEKCSLENRQLEDELKQANEELEKRAKQRQHMRHQYEVLGLAMQE